MKKKKFVHPEVSKHYSEIGKKGGVATLQKYGLEHYERMRKKRWDLEKERIKVAMSKKPIFIRKSEFKMMPINLEEVDD